ncbi:MAG: Gfo/Idh/MocA family oxidoreductase [Candidatus Handelsmanbacteria bacterium]|nr:Gfo/Idh/MocA family oxidoreductase [Candidatus Handelsmanbacteria bacterium]
MYRIGVVGAGGVGQKRAAAAAAHPESELAQVCDLDLDAARALARQYGAGVADSWEELVKAKALDAVVVSTTHEWLAPISAAALRAGKHVLAEKPLGRNPDEARLAVAAAAEAGRWLKAGYNHRYHPAILKVRQVCEAGELGPLHFIRGRYGHGGRPGYEREWRADPARSGGGELLDQGAHLVDLSLWFLGDFARVSGEVGAHFWPIAPLEDNAFGLFATPAGQVASLHVSWTQWKNLFSFEVFGRDGYACAQGLGRSYGPEMAVVGRRAVQGGPPQEQRFDFPGEDRSWDLEWADFVAAMATGRPPQAEGREAVRTLEWIFRLYRAAREGRSVGVGES